MPQKISAATRFENALADLVEIHLRDGATPTDISGVLRARADDDYEEFAKELLLSDLSQEKQKYIDSLTAGVATRPAAIEPKE